MIFEKFHPEEKYTTRIKNILTEYPDGSQILREILQNSDDAKSTVQIFILNHKTYPSEALFDPKLKRYQGPALLSANDTIFQPEDFKSLMCAQLFLDLPTFLSILMRENIVKWKLDRGHPDQFNPFLVDFIKSKLITKNPHQFDDMPDGFHNGTIFRYPLRTSRDAEESEISNKQYNIEQIKELFKIFFNVDNVSCLLFLKHIEKILFFEIKENEDIPDLLYEIGVDNVNEIIHERELLTKNMISMMKSPTGQDSFETIYRMKFSQKAKNINNKSDWLIVNYTSSTNDEKYIKFKNHIRDCKFVPSVGLAVRIDKVSKNKGKLFCFLPLPDNYDDFSVSVNGCFAVSKNRRNLEISMDEDLVPGDLLRLKGAWNRYLFEKAIPEAWKKLLTEIIKINNRNVSHENIYTLWPLPANGSSQELDTKYCLWKNLLQDLINLLEPNLKVFCGPSGYLSINDGYLNDEDFYKSSDLSKILEKLGFPIFVNIPKSIVAKLKESLYYKDILKYITPEKVCDYLKKSDKPINTLLDRLNRQNKLILLEYILEVNDVSNLHGIPLLPVKNKTFATFESKDNPEKLFYITSRNEHKLKIIDKKHFDSFIDNEIDDLNLSKDLSKNNKILSKDDKILSNDLSKDDKILLKDDKILSKLKFYAKDGKNINIQILSEIQFLTILKSSLEGYSENSQEIPIRNNKIEWIYEIWDHLLQTNRNLSNFENLHLLPIKKSYNIFLRKLKATPKCLCRSPRNQNNNDISVNALTQILNLLGSTFIIDDFEKQIASKYQKLKNYLIEPDNVTAVLLSLREDKSFPRNITESDLKFSDKNFLVKYMRTYLQNESYFDAKLIEVIKYFPIFTTLNIYDKSISIDSIAKVDHYLLPKEDEKSAGRIISDCIFLETHTSDDISFLLEKVLKVKRLEQRTYWKDHVIRHLNNQQPDIQDQMIEKLFQRWEIIKPFLSDLSKISFVTTSSQRKTPNEIFDPNNIHIKGLFFSNESFFPTGIYLNNQDYLYKLRQLGMKNLMTIEDLINRLDTYATSNTSDRYSKSLELLKYIDDNCNDLINDSSFREEIQNREWIPVLKENKEKTFLKASECRDELHQNLVSYIIPIVQYKIKNNALRQMFGWNDDPPALKVIEQLLYLTNLINQNGSYSDMGNRIYKIYDHLNNVVKNSNNDINLWKNKLSGNKWIFNDDKLYTTDEIVFSSIVKSDMVTLSNYNKNNYSKLFHELGVKHEQDYFKLLANYKFSDKTQKTIIDMIEHLSHTEDENKLKELLIPNMNGNMVPCKELFYDDMDTRAKDSDKDFNTIVHSSISRDIAKKLKLRNFSEIFLKGRIDLVRQNDNVTATFLKTILEKFDDEKIVFQEFLKNADDAGAEQFCIILDECTYSSEYLIKEDMKCWQGPAIWIYNEKEFSLKDLESLNDIGRCVKGPDEIGRYGLGFASCYNFTDMPQIISGWKIIFFDPQRKIFSDKQCYGSIFDFEDYKREENHIMKVFKDQFESYLNLEGCGFKVDYNKKFNGTLFRLPLRTVESPISNKVYTAESSVDIFDRIEKLLDVIKKDAISELIFLRKVKSIKVFRKRSLDNAMKPLWDTEIKKIFTGNRKSLGKESQVLKLEVQYNEFAKQTSEKSTSKTVKWLICATEKDDKNLWSAIAGIISKEQDKEIFNGKFYSYLSLSDSSELPVVLHSNGWELSSNRRSLAQNNENNTKILNNISQLHVKFFEEIANIGQQEKQEKQENETYQIISQFWPIPEIENDTFKIKEYGQKVVEYLCRKNSEVFWSPYNGGKYVNLKNSVFINDETPEKIVEFLNEHDHPTIKIKPEHLNEFKEKKGYRQVNPQLVRKILKDDESILDETGISLLKRFSLKHILEDKNHKRVSLLKYILEDENYNDLEKLSLVPLFKNKFGKFATEKNYTIATLEELNLFPKAGLEYFIPDGLLSSYSLQTIFYKNEFLKATNIQKFDESTIRRFLQQELPPISERDWNPLSLTIPNKKWLNEIWSRILNHSLAPYRPFPLLEVYDPSKQDQHQLISLENAACKPLLVYPVYFEYGFDITQTLINIGIRFTKHKFDEKLNEYIKLLQPDNILNVIGKYQCIEDQLINKKKDIENLCQYFTTKLLPSDYQKCVNKQIFEQLPIWSIHTLGSKNPVFKSISDPNTYLVPSGKNSSSPFTFFPQNQNRTFYYNATYESRKLLEAAGAKIQSRLNYYKETFVQDMKEILPHQRNSYSELLIEMLCDTENLDAIKPYIKNLKIFPDEKYQLYVARDLNDQDNQLLQIIYKNSNRFLPKCIQSNQDCLNVLEELGFVRKVTPEIFIKCVIYIQNLFNDFNNHKNIMIKLDDLKYLGRTALTYFYNNQSTLKFSEDEWEELSKIKFIPISKSLLKYPYSYSSNKNMKELECFENLCLSKYKNFVWTQLAFFDIDPTEEVIENYKDLGQPTVSNIVNHLKTIQSTISKSEDWDQKGDELFDIIKQIYEKLDSLCDERNDDLKQINDDLKQYFSDNPPLFLNGENPFDSEIWTPASHLDITIKKDFNAYRKATAEYLKNYEKLLILAGAKKGSKLPINGRPENFEEKNAQHLINSMIDSLCIGENTNELNDVSFDVNGQNFHANSMVLSCAASYFKTIQQNSFDDVDPDSFNILLRWLYGESLSQAINNIGRKEYDDDFIQICNDLLKLAKKFELESLKRLIEQKLFAHLDFNLNEDILEKVKSLAASDEYKLIDLSNHCDILEKEYY
ncbi:12515_t:CDS:2 [Dentiscutata heterogama]|uniref:12515_t:CDS:1 n=1 Tax=Dentiscutata heterogama TaxID=1316150 RepID=A0ACA9K8J0_9GLOM|nr:12515_t:CDS:2 [Dentiscutata heterogama]